MPEDFDRRGLLRRAGMGAAAVGALTIAGPALGDLGQANAATPKRPVSDEPVMDGTDVIAHVIDARAGKISILVGTREIHYTNREMAQEIMRAAK